MSDAWPKVPLVELLRQTSDAHPVIAGEEYPNFGILSFGRGLFSKQAISGARSSAKTLFRARKSQFIYSRLFAFEGAYGLVTEGYDGHFVSNEYPMFDCDEERILPEYLHSYFKSPRVWEDVARLSTGMGDRRRRIQPEQLLTHRMPLPPLPEQRRIVARIEELANRIAEVKLLRSESSKAATALVTAGAASIVDRLSAERLPLGRVVSIRGGGTPAKDMPHYWGGQIPWVTPKDMKRDELYDSEDRVTEEAIRDREGMLLPSGAVLVVVRGMILARAFPVAVLRVKGMINQDMKALLPKDVLSSEYLASVLRAWENRVLDLVERSGHDTRRLETSKLLGLEIPVPEPAVQSQIVRSVIEHRKKVGALLETVTKSDSELNALLPLVMDRAFRGEQ